MLSKIWNRFVGFKSVQESSVYDGETLQAEYAASLRRIADLADIEADARHAAQWGTHNGWFYRFCMWVARKANERRLEEVIERDFWLGLLRHNSTRREQ